VASAVDVRIDVNRASGKSTQPGFAPLLEPSPPGRYANQPEPRLDVFIDASSNEWPPPGGEYVTATVTYSDVRGAGTWKRSTSADLHRAQGVEPDAPPFPISFQRYTEGDDTQVAPPPHSGAPPSPLLSWLRSVLTQWKGR
jgi:hypothetical protein